MTDYLSFIFKDDEAEDAILRNIDDFNAIYYDAKQWSELKCSQMLTDEELKRYEGLVPGSNLGSRRRAVINLIKSNPCLRTMNPDVLYQRVTFFMWRYGEKSQKVHRRRKSPILKTFQKLEQQQNKAE